MKKTMKKSSGLSRTLIAASTILPLASAAFAAETPAAVSTDWQKPAWLTDLSAGVKESYDDNVLLVADKNPGMSAQSSWITTVSPKVGFNFAPLLGTQKTLQTLSLVYAPDFNIYHDASSESYNAHKLANAIKGKTGDFSFALENAFLFNDGSSTAPTYALNQNPAPAPLTGLYQADKNRSAYATATARERRKQIQDRSTVVLQYDVGKFFIRPTASLLYYDLMTDWQNGSAKGYKGYQNYVDRADVNGGLDLGYKVTDGMAVTVGYRYGHQYQQALPHSDDTLKVNGQQAQSSADYQRLLLGLEGKPLKWLTVKLAGGPEFRDYNSAAPVNNDHPVNYYGEASVSAAITTSQTLSFTYKHWQWVSSTGKLPYADNTYALAYHLNATKKLGLDLGAKYLFSDYTCGSTSLTGGNATTAGQSQRNDAMYSLSAGASYAFTPHFSASLGYTCNLGRNQQDNVGALVGYRDFDQNVVSLGVQYKF
jgi:opacity protein-like surface antigen